jgi:hypothetical protein
VKRVGNSVIYSGMLRKNKSNPNVLAGCSSKTTEKSQVPVLKKFNSDIVEDQSTTNGMYIMEMHNASKRTEKTAVIMNKEKRLKEKVLEKVKIIRLPEIPKETCPRQSINNKIRWLIPSPALMTLTQVERETNLLNFNFIPSLKKKEFPQTFKEIMENEGSTETVLGLILESLRESFFEYQPLFKYSLRTKEVLSRANYLLEFYFGNTKILDRLLHNICYHLEVFCFLAKTNKKRSKNSSLLSMEILILLMNNFDKIRSTSMKEHLKDILITNWHELQNCFYKILKIEQGSEREISLNAFDIEKRFGRYSGLSLHFLLSLLHLMEFDSRLVAEFHESLLNSLLIRFLSGKLSSVHNQFLYQIIEGIFTHCSEEQLMLLGFKLEFFRRFKQSIFKIKQDLFEEQDLQNESLKKMQRGGSIEILRNVLDIESLFLGLISRIIQRVETKYREFDQSDQLSVFFDKKRTKQNLNKSVLSEKLDLSKLKLNESQVVNEYCPAYNLMFIRESHNYRILKDFFRMKNKFGIKMKVFVLDNTDHETRNVKCGKHESGDFGFKLKSISPRYLEIPIGGLDNSINLKKKKVYTGNLHESEIILNSKVLKRKMVKLNSKISSKSKENRFNFKQVRGHEYANIIRKNEKKSKKQISREHGNKGPSEN